MKLLITLLLAFAFFNGAFGLEDFFKRLMGGLNNPSQDKTAIEKELEKIFDNNVKVDIKIDTDNDLVKKINELDIKIDLTSMSSEDVKTFKKIFEAYFEAKKNNDKDKLAELKKILESLVDKLNDDKQKMIIKQLIEKITADLKIQTLLLGLLENFKSAKYKVTISIGQELKKALEKLPGSKMAKNTIDAMANVLDALQKDLDAIESGKTEIDLKNKSMEQIKKCKEGYEKVKEAWAKLKKALSESLDSISASGNLIKALSELMKEKITKAVMDLIDGFYKMLSNGVKVKDLLSNTIEALYEFFNALIKDITANPTEYKILTTEQNIKLFLSLL